MLNISMDNNITKYLAYAGLGIGAYLILTSNRKKAVSKPKIKDNPKPKENNPCPTEDKKEEKPKKKSGRLVKGSKEAKDYMAKIRKMQKKKKKVSSYEKGGIVKETGLAKLHKGEKVIPKEEVSNDSVKELVLYIENDSDLHRQRHEPIRKNLIKKHKKGQYKSELAIKSFKLLADEGAKKYCKEFGGTWNETFYVSERKAVAKELRDAFEQEYIK